jgi:hypothetical protein
MLKQYLILKYYFNIFFFIIIFSSCKEKLLKNKYKETSVQEGKELAIKYCQSCHLLPDPSLVNTKSWEIGILPKMGPRLGIFFHNDLRYPVNTYDFALPRDFYPKKPMLTSIEWQKIIDYYLALSPDSLDLKQKRDQPIQNTMNQFEVLEPRYNGNAPATTYVSIDEKNENTPFIYSDVLNYTFYRYNKNGNLVDTFKTNGPIVGMIPTDNNWLVCDIGILNPHNGTFGSIRQININNNKFKSETAQPIISNLQRPVQFQKIDLNSDKRDDLIVCEFGNLTGAFTWYEQKKDGKYEKHILRQVPGSIKFEIQDFNKDGLPDIWALFAQGDECIILYTNLGGGKFKEDRILRFPTINGSSYFELADFNNDGFQDIVYTCGDNADNSAVLKPYHGVYIYLNDGKNNFTQKYFYSINGCYKAIARDFDKDGDLDIATISYFPDSENQPEEGFVYFENKGGGLNFTPSSSQSLTKGRWLTMNVGDYNQDGYLDLIFGNFSLLKPIVKSEKDWKKGPPFMVLKNKGIQK